MSKLKIERKPNPYRRTLQVGIRLNEEEVKRIQRMAEQYTDGVMSEYVRYAAMNFTPLKKDFSSPS